MKNRLQKFLALVCCLVLANSFCVADAEELVANSVLKPYMISFGDNIAIRLLSDGSIEATVEAYEQAEWNVFVDQGSYWAVQYTDDEYREEMAQHDSFNSFAKMQESSDYIDVSAECYGVLAAVHEDGTVAFNKRAEQRYDTTAGNSKWRDIKDIDLGAYSIIALKNDGTMVTDVWSSSYAFTEGTNPKNWKDVKAIDHNIIAVGLREDGTVYYSHPDFDSEFEPTFIPLETISDWTDIVQVATAWFSVVGLKADGTVVAAGEYDRNKLDVSGWTDITKIAIGGYNCVAGLKKDGTLVATVPWALDSADGLADGRTINNAVDIYANGEYILAVLDDGSTRLLGEKADWVSYDGAWPAKDWEFPLKTSEETAAAEENTSSETAAVVSDGTDTWICSNCKAGEQKFAFCTNCGASKQQTTSPAETIINAEEIFSKIYPIGSRVTFGHYDQDRKKSGNEEIVWIIIDNSDCELLLLSELALADVPYDTSWDYEISWKDSTLRKWLNNNFLDAAFTESERSIIKVSEVNTVRADRSDITCVSEDSVTLLDLDEVTALNEEWVIATGSGMVFDANNQCPWWLRDGGVVNIFGDIVAPWGSTVKSGVDICVEDARDFFYGRNYGARSVRPLIRVVPDRTADPMPASHVSNVEKVHSETGLTYMFNLSGLTITGCRKSPSSLTIPDTIDGYPVTSIAAEAFRNSDDLKEIVLPNYLISIGAQAFRGCDTLAEVVIPDSVQTIGDGAFYYCDALQSVILGKNIQSIGAEAFDKCALLTDLRTSGTSDYLTQFVQSYAK